MLFILCCLLPTLSRPFSRSLATLSKCAPFLAHIDFMSPSPSFLGIRRCASTASSSSSSLIALSLPAKMWQMTRIKEGANPEMNTLIFCSKPNKSSLFAVPVPMSVPAKLILLLVAASLVAHFALGMDEQNGAAAGKSSKTPKAQMPKTPIKPKNTKKIDPKVIEGVRQTLKFEDTDGTPPTADESSKKPNSTKD